MVQVETSQLIAECNEWRQALRDHRESFTRDKTRLQEAVSRQLTRSQLEDVEHLHNQFHIQLINIHDLKQAIKAHSREIDYEMNVQSGKLRTETHHIHENLHGRFEGLMQTLRNLRTEFEAFLSHT